MEKKPTDKDAKSSTLSSIEVDGKTLTKERNVLEALNCHFVSVGPKLARSIETRPQQTKKCRSNQSTKSM